MNEIMLDNSCLPVMSVCDLCAAPEDFYHADRTVDFHVMIYVVEGVVYVTEGDVDYEIHAGEMLFLKSGIRHRGKRAIERGTRWYFIHFYLEETGGIPAFSPDSSAPVPHVPVRLCAELPKKLTGLLGSELERAAFRGKEKSQPRTLSDRICEYLNGQIAQPFSAGKLEKQFFLSYKHMAAVFKKEKQLTLQQYHNKVRMTEACRLLISKELGYPDMLYFSRCFHRFAGMSPTQYRKSVPSFY